ncbi:DNHD1 [Bugula neritina]|uniref:DNHD1 n=1 Tax=Bugula neritina TaxID=10212 RepID=A0A7J7KEX2_BUGNE|nr:DNHD1 [Bugula neritina]
MIDQVILAQLVDIIKASVSSFIYTTLQNVPGDCREAMFKCSVHFNTEGVLDIVPSRSEFTKAIRGAIHDLPQTLCDVSYAIDAEYLVNERVETMRPETRYTAIGTATKQKSTEQVLPKPSSNQKHVRLTVAELKSHTDRKMPRKQDESMLVRTPELALPMADELELVGKGYTGKYAPLTSTNVSQLLLDDASHQSIIKEGDVILDSAFDEVEAFVQENSWFNDIYSYCATWDVKAKLSWKGAQAFHIECGSCHARNIGHQYSYRLIIMIH